MSMLILRYLLILKTTLAFAEKVQTKDQMLSTKKCVSGKFIRGLGNHTISLTINMEVGTALTVNASVVCFFLSFSSVL